MFYFALGHLDLNDYGVEYTLKKFNYRTLFKRHLNYVKIAKHVMLLKVMKIY